VGKKEEEKCEGEKVSEKMKWKEKKNKRKFLRIAGRLLFKGSL
jgi:hypothetical protein